MRAEARRRVVDKVAAAVMLQAWLDAGAPAPPCTRSTRHQRRHEHAHRGSRS